MNVFDFFYKSDIHHGDYVCGDAVFSKHREKESYFLLIDGVGHGPYAHVTANMYGARLMELLRGNQQFELTCSELAVSINEGKQGEAVYAAFTAVKILSSGYYTIYGYEAPDPLLFREQRATVMQGEKIQSHGVEMVLYTGTLNPGEQIFFCSDGVTQSGMGHHLLYGIGSDGAAEFLNEQLRMCADAPDYPLLLDQLIDYCSELCGGVNEDDVTAAFLCCREGTEMLLASGPPRKRERDERFAAAVASFPYAKAVCGSTTIDVIARELGLETEGRVITYPGGSPPEYLLDGIDLATEGDYMLNLVCRHLATDRTNYSGDYQAYPEERLCHMLMNHDVIHMHIGRAVNPGYDEKFFLQTGLKPRKEIVTELTRILRRKGKQVLIELY